MVYSITSRTSLERARHYLEILAQYQRLAASDRPIILVGNKMDLERYRLVVTEPKTNIQVHWLGILCTDYTVRPTLYKAQVN